MADNIHPTIQHLAVPISDLKPYPTNPRRGDVSLIADSLQHNGQYRPIVVNQRTREVLAGNHTLKAAQQLGWITIAATYVDADEQQAARIVAIDNRANDLASYDNTQLVALLTDLPDLAGTGYTTDDLDQLLASLQPEELPPAALTDPDDVPETPEEPYSKPGDLWHLGPHRLLCGDATNPDHIARVTADTGTPGIIYTDPPYGIKAVPKDGGVSRGGRFKGKGGIDDLTVAANKYAPIIGDDTTDTARDSFALLLAAFPEARHVWWGGNHYTGSARLPDSSCWLVWDKVNHGNDFADCELAWTNHPGAVRMLSHMWNGMLRASERGKRVHPTQKPAALASWAFGVVDAKGERTTVLDVFGGSGSTLIAAHMTNRTAAIIEMEPAYIDVICRRYQEHTGVLPILAATGEPHDFTANP